MAEEKIWENIVRNLTEEQVIDILTDLGSATPSKDKDGNLLFQSVCHDSNSWKLCYYVEAHDFFCYKEWEHFNIFNLVMRVKGMDFSQALKYVCDLIHYDYSTKKIQQGFGNNYTKADWDIFSKLNIPSFIKDEEVEYFNSNILNLYTNAYYQGWIKEFINIEAMEKFQIKYDICGERIIIPHFDIDNNLIGIRCRNLSELSNAKYCPVTIEDKWYAHPLSKNLYGINHNKFNIQKLKKAMIVESEKSVLQCESYFMDNNFTVACCGSNISYEQINLLIGLGVTEVILAMDWDFHEQSDKDIEYINYKQKIIKLSQKLLPYFSVEVLLPIDDKFIYKCSPADLGKEYLLQSMKRKQTITYEIIVNTKGEKNG